MRPYDELDRRGQLARMRRVARRALGDFGEDPSSPLTVLRHEHNTTFRVDGAHRGAMVVRIQRPEQHAPGAIEAEMAWLSALSEQTDLGVPRPHAARDGRCVVVIDEPGMDEARPCVLLDWVDGRFHDAALDEARLAQVARLHAALHDHGRRWTPPPGFVRPRVDNLTGATKHAEVFGDAAAARAMPHPLPADVERAAELVAALFSADDATVISDAIDRVSATSAALSRASEGFALIHGDLHHENYLFAAGRAKPIDFDDCGWGFTLYDLAVTISELDHLPRREALTDALLAAYAQHASLPDDHRRHIDALIVLRRVQLLMWVLESRAHVAFRDTWREEGRAMLDGLRAATRDR